MRWTFAVTLISSLVFSIAANANQGVFMVVKGDVQVQAKGGSLQKAKPGLKVNEGDTIIAGADARAKVVMVDKNVLNISPDSKVLIEKYVFNEGSNQKNVSLNVLYGKMRSTVKQKYDGEKNTFNVKTPSAVAGVRGTDFVTSFNNVTNTSKIVTFEGSVQMGTGIGPGGVIQNAVAVNPGQFSVAGAGSPPTAPAAVPKAELASMQKDTNAETGSSDKRDPASDGGGKGEKGDKEKKDGDKADDKGSDKGTKDDGKAEGKGDGDKGGGDKGDKGGDGKGDGGGHSAEGGGGEGHAPAGEMGGGMGGGMGVDQGDMMAGGSGMEPVAGPDMPAFDCPTCGMPAGAFPAQLPPDLMNSGGTHLHININN